MVIQMLAYIIEQYYDYKMVDGKDVVEQAHEIQGMVKKRELQKLVVPDLFVARGIITKLPPSWRDFSTTLKTKMTHMSTSDFIASLDVEEKAWAKDGQYKVVEGQTSTNMVHQPQSHGKGKDKKNKNNNKAKQNTNFKKKKDEGCVAEPPQNWGIHHLKIDRGDSRQSENAQI
jgi:hypothetical protein